MSMPDAFKDSPYSLLFDYRSLEARFDADEARVASLLRQVGEIRSRQRAYVQDQCRIVARLAPAFARLKNPVKWREGFQDYAVTHDPDCDFLTFTPLMEAGDLDAKHLGDLADSMLAESDQAALLKAFRDDDPNDDTGEYEPVKSADECRTCLGLGMLVDAGVENAVCPRCRGMKREPRETVGLPAALAVIDQEAS